MTAPARRRRIRSALLAALRFYQRAVSPALPPRCRFSPTCSAYAVEAIERHGAARGGWLALRRLVKCAPWHPGGFDPVPPAAADSGRSGTREGGHSSTAGMPGATVPRTDPLLSPAPRRTPQQEAGVA